MFQQVRLIQENQSSEMRGPGGLGRAGLDLWGPKAPGWKRNQRLEEKPEARRFWNTRYSKAGERGKFRMTWALGSEL